MSVKVGVADGGVDVSQVIAAIDWVVQHRNDNGLNIRVINLSYGTNSTQAYAVDPLAYAVEQAWKAGIVVVAAAGNTGYQNAMGPASPTPRTTRRSSRSARPTRLARRRSRTTRWRRSRRAATRRAAGSMPSSPGAHMQGLRVAGSYIDQNNPGAALGSLYFRGSGTSEAAAYASGVIALLLQKYPLLTPDQVKLMLASSCVKLASFDSQAQGCGELDLTKLLKALVPAAPTQPPDMVDRQRLARAVARRRPPDDEWCRPPGRADHLRSSVQLDGDGGSRGLGVELVGRELERLDVVG